VHGSVGKGQPGQPPAGVSTRGGGVGDAITDGDVAVADVGSSFLEVDAVLEVKVARHAAARSFPASRSDPVNILSS
jgi:hypothetical protein